MKTESQISQIRQWLESGKTLTSLEAFREFGTLRLSGHIFVLRERGLPINTTLINIDGKQIAEYSLVKN